MGRRRRARTAHVGRDAHARRRGGRRGKARSGYETEAAGHRRNTEHRASRCGGRARKTLCFAFG